MSLKSSAHLVEYFTKLSLVLDGEEDLLGPRNVRERVEELFDDGRRAVEFESEVRESLCDSSHLRAGDVSTDEDTRVRLRYSESVRRSQRGPVSFGEGVSEGGDFSCRSHLCGTFRQGQPGLTTSQQLERM